MFLPNDSQQIDVVLNAKKLPIAVIWEGKKLLIMEISNSYRVDAGSLENPIWREYFEILTEDGWWILIYHDLLDPHWQWEIAYD
jgi:hypothetical protein